MTTSEQHVVDTLKTAAVPGTACGSLYLPEHNYKLTAVADWVLITDQAAWS